VPRCSLYGGVNQLGSRAGAAQHESAAAHVAAAYEIDRKKEAVAENFEKRVSVLPTRDAAEKHIRAIGPCIFVEQFR